MGGVGQGFGGLLFDNAEAADDYVRDLCAAFGVHAMIELVGKKCFALYSFGEHNEFIEGLESCDTGRRFLHNAWRKKRFPDTRDRLSQEKERLWREIAWAEWRAAEAKNRLDTLESRYVDWETK